jgi:hypothetical protein
MTPRRTTCGYHRAFRFAARHVLEALEGCVRLQREADGLKFARPADGQEGSERRLSC